MKKLLVVASKAEYMEVVKKVRERFDWGTASHSQAIYWDSKPETNRGYLKIAVLFSKKEFDWLVQLCKDTLPEGSWETFPAYEARLGRFARGWSGGRGWGIEAQRHEEKGPSTGEHNKIRIRYR